MNAKIAQKWVDALRSGKYKPTANRLRKTDGYCCLGVLCDLAAQEGLGGWGLGGWESGNAYYFVTSPNEEHGTTHLPRAVIEWAGMQSNYNELAKPALIENKQYRYLTEINDELPDDKPIFELIAQTIEENRETL